MGPPPDEGIPGLCVYATKQGCSCYEERPIMCRLFGAVEDLRCPRGAGPIVLMTRTTANALLVEYADGTIEVTDVRLEEIAGSEKGRPA
jgi:Fe-S-cluster containining protein